MSGVYKVCMFSVCHHCTTDVCVECCVVKLLLLHFMTDSNRYFCKYIHHNYITLLTVSCFNVITFIGLVCFK